MKKVVPLVRQLQADALDNDVPVSALLRLAKVIATKLDQKDALTWIDKELNGYMGLKMEDVPPYRIVCGTPKGFNPYHGWRTIDFQDPEHARMFSRAVLGEGIGSLEKGLREHKGTVTFPYSPENKAMLQDAMNIRVDVTLFLNDGALWSVVETVRNLVLNWSLELEKAGVLGEAMTFTEEEKREGGNVTQQFIIQNVGVLGNVGDKAKVKNLQSAWAAIDIPAVEDFLKQALIALPQPPKEARAKLEPVLEEIGEEVVKETGTTDGCAGY